MATLSEAAPSWVLSEAAFCLRAQGRFAEALPAQRAALAAEAAKDWRNAANLLQSQRCELLVGEVASAVATAERAVAHADRSGNQFEIIMQRTTQADVMQAAGRREEAEQLFADAERRQRQSERNCPLLYSLQGYQYCDLLLAKGEWAAARDRAAQTLEWAKARQPLRDIALDRLTLGRAHLGLALAACEPSASPAERQRDARTARARLDEAVDGLRAAGDLRFVPSGLLARAAFRRSVGDWKRAARDLDEVEEIAEPGPMKLHLCDVAIERARLAFAQIEAFAPLNGLLETDNPPKPSPPSADEARALEDRGGGAVEDRCGIHRDLRYHRDEELAELEAGPLGVIFDGSRPPMACRLRFRLLPNFCIAANRRVPSTANFGLT